MGAKDEQGRVFAVYTCAKGASHKHWVRGYVIPCASTKIRADNGVSNAWTFRFILDILTGFFIYIHSAILFLTYTYT